MTVEELINSLKQYPPGLPVVVFNRENDEIMKIPEIIPDIILGTQTVNNKELTVILCGREISKEYFNEVKRIQDDKANTRLRDSKDKSIEGGESNSFDRRDNNRNSKRRRKHR